MPTARTPLCTLSTSQRSMAKSRQFLLSARLYKHHFCFTFANGGSLYRTKRSHGQKCVCPIIVGKSSVTCMSRQYEMDLQEKSSWLIRGYVQTRMK